MGWYRRKPKNRRLGNERVLDVKLSSDRVRASRLRWLALGLVLLFVTVFCFFAIWRGTQWALNRLIYENKRFAIQSIEVQTDGVMAVDQLRRWSGVKPGENLFALDTGRVKRDLEMVTIIRSVAVERVPPNMLRLRIMERVPMAQAAIYPPSSRANATNTTNAALQMNNFVQIDRDGYVITPPDPRQRAIPVATNQVLPLITGINPADLIPGRAIPEPPARAALELIQSFKRSPMSGLVDLQRIDISSPGVLQVATGQGAEITFSIAAPDAQTRADELDKQMRRWHVIFVELQKKGKMIASLDLSVPSNIPAKWVDAGTVIGTTPVPAPKNKNPQHTRKKNV